MVKGDDPDNRLFVWFAGHGHTINGEGFLIPADAPRPEAGALFRLKALSMRRFGEYVRLARSKHAMAVFDACFSGTIFDTQRSAPPPAITRSTTLPVRQFLASGDADQTVSDDGRFRKLFVRAITGEERADANSDGYVTGSELGMFLTDRMTNLTRNRQTPRYGKLRDMNWDRGDFVFVVASSGAVVEDASKSVRKTTLSLDVNVAGAKVMMDGKSIGTTDIRNMDISPGTHRIRVEKPGYEPYERTIDVAQGRAVSLYVDLSRERVRNGRLYVDTAPSDARIRILNIGPKFYQGMDLAPGSYHVEVSAAGYEMKKLWVDLGAGENKQLDVQLSKSQPHARTSVKGTAASGDFWDAPATGKKVTNTLGMEFVHIPPGTFMMGSPSSEPGRDSDERQHKVTLTKGFYLQTTEVTQGQWQAVMGNNPSYFKNCGDDCPVENVFWNDAKAFIEKLNRREMKSGSRVRYGLPTEAQWEYACRAGSSTALYNGNIRILGDNNAPALDDIAWYGGNSCVSYSGGYKCYGWKEKQYSCSNCGTHPTGQKIPNAWGLYDMIGNVWEWCQDWKGDYPTGAVTNPDGPSSGAYRVYRGGSWFNRARLCRSANRDYGSPGYRYGGLGFRLLRTE